MKKLLCLLALALAGLTASAQPAITRSGRVLFVSNTGSDATAQKDRPDLPWQTIAGALSNALAGDTVLLSAEGFLLTNAVTVPQRVALVGQGYGLTLITNMFTNSLGSPQPVLMLSGSSPKVADLAVWQYVTNSYQAGIGTHFSDGGAFTNALIERVKCYGGETDALYVRHTNFCSLTAVDSFFGARWDCITSMGVNGVTPAPAHKMNFFRCRVEALGTNSFGGATAQRSNCLATEVGTNQAILFWDSVLVASNGTATVFSLATSWAGRVDFVRCDITNRYSTHILGNCYAGQTAAFQGGTYYVPGLDDEFGDGTLLYATTRGNWTWPPLREPLAPAKLTAGKTTVTSGADAPTAAELEGSLYLRDNGQLYIRTNATWVAK